MSPSFLSSSISFRFCPHSSEAPTAATKAMALLGVPKKKKKVTEC